MSTAACRSICLLAILGAALLLVLPEGSAARAPVAQAPPAALRLDPFYRKYLDAGGIPVVASDRVPDPALATARTLVDGMLAARPDIRAELVRSGARVGVMAVDEGTTDLPEQRDWKKPAADDPRLTPCEREHYDRIAAMSDRDYWNGRARGMGGLYTTGAAENLLGVPGTRYYGENILVHEFSHSILSAVERVDPVLYAKVRQAYDAALQRGLWQGDYAAVTVQEYWAEGTQFWFESNKLSLGPGRRVLSAEDLRRYDPGLYAVLGAVYGRGHRLPGDVYHRHPARADVPPPAAKGSGSC